MKTFYSPLIFLLGTLSAGNVSAIDYFVMDFEDGQQPPVSTPPNAQSIWTLPPVFADNYGPGNFFEITDNTAHSGNYSMRFTYEARNGFCNTCGLKRVPHKQGLDGVNFFVADTGEDLTELEDVSTSKANDGPNAKPGRFIYNKDNGFSKWEITSVVNDTAVNDKLLVKLSKPAIDGSTSEFNSNDEVSIARVCGVDGHVGNKIDRRSDCDNVITWFTNIAAGTQAPGASIYRRQYLKAEVTSLGAHQKLHFFRVDNGGPNAANIIIYGDSRHTTELVPEITGFRTMNGPAIFKPSLGNGLPANMEFKRGLWYYMEEQYKAATLNPAFDQAYYDSGQEPEFDANGNPNPNYNPTYDPNDPRANKYNQDGEYRLWFSEAGQEDTVGATPILEVTQLTMPPISGGSGTHVSFWGNVQHDVHLRGSWYIDDIYISDAPIGKAVGGGINKSPPTPPRIIVNTP